MKTKMFYVNSTNNCCTVFELPKIGIDKFRFKPNAVKIPFKMVDYFLPVSDINLWQGTIKNISQHDLEVSIISIMKSKEYYRKGDKYLVLCGWDMALLVQEPINPKR
jgi:hypothetical protein